MKKYGNKSLLFGILGIIFCWLIFGIIFSILGLVFSFKGLKNKMEKQGKIVAGLILSVLSLIFSILMIIVFIAAGGSSGNTDNPAPPVSAETEAEISAEPERSEKQEDTEKNNKEEQEKPKEKKLSAKEYKKQCKEFNYKDVLRNPDDYVGQKVKVTVKVSSVHQESFGMPKYYFAYTNDDMDWWLGDEYGIFEYRAEDDFKILEDDIITVYGEIASPRETTSLIVNSEEIFCIDMKYADLIEE